MTLGSDGEPTARSPVFQVTERGAIGLSEPPHPPKPSPLRIFVRRLLPDNPPPGLSTSVIVGFDMPISCWGPASKFFMRAFGKIGPLSLGRQGWWACRSGYNDLARAPCSGFQDLSWNGQFGDHSE